MLPSLLIALLPFCCLQLPEEPHPAADTSCLLKRAGRGILRYFTESNRPKAGKRFDFSLIGGPHFSGDTKLGAGVVASGLYRVDRSDLSLPPSNLSLYGDITTTGFCLLGIRGNTIFRGDRYRLSIHSHFFSLPGKYWGIGYAAGNRRNGYTTYKRLEIQFRAEFSRRLFPSAYLGVVGLFRQVNGRRFRDPAFLKGEKPDLPSLGCGLSLTYDSRDFLPNPSRGGYAHFEQLFFPSLRGYRFRRSELTLRKYGRIWKGGILAAELQGISNCGKIPWSMTALLGGSYRMRGYYEGRYRDNNLIQFQAELRQHLRGRHGIALWGGAGNVFPDFKGFRGKETLPSCGIGYRWEFKKRVNVRLDYGIGKGQSAFYFNIDEAF